MYLLADYRSWIISILIVFFYMVLGSSAFAEGDFTYRPGFTITAPISSHFKWIGAITSKLSIDAEASDEIAFITGAIYKPIRNMTLSSDIKYITKNESGEKNESRPRFCLEFSYPTKKFKVALRNRFEYRMEEGKDNYLRYRARMKLELPKIIQTSPYFFEEIFYEFGAVDKLSRNESGVGLMIPFFNKTRLDIEFMFQNNKKDGGWQAPNLHFFTKLKYNL
jgi:hypothetical protein